MSQVEHLLGRSQSRWLVTGAAGFIGSHLLEVLLSHGQHVRAVDNLATGHRRNIEEVIDTVGPEAAARFEFVRDSICSPESCRAMVKDIDYVLHQAALGSVPRSIKSPLGTFDANVNGFVNLLTAAKDSTVKRFVYASSSSVYGDHPDLPKVEGKVGRPLSPYAATKAADELFADVYARVYGLSCVGLRYFNVFGRRQDPEGAYAAVIPRWIASLIHDEQIVINGDGLTSRDFCHVDNAVQANIRAALIEPLPVGHCVFNVAAGRRTTLLELFELIKGVLSPFEARVMQAKPVFGPFRDGDVRHSLADITAARMSLGYSPVRGVDDGLKEAISWYVNRARVGAGP